MATIIKKILFTCTAFLVFFTTAYSAELSGVKVEDTYTKHDVSLVLNGFGLRDKFFMDLYVGELYLSEKNKSAKEIIEATKEMNIHLHIISSLITSANMEEATREGFDNATNGNIEPIKNEIETFINVFKKEINIDDVYDFLYKPSVGIEVYKNNTLEITIKSYKFKKALFGIWLSEKPAQESLKKELLGI